MNSLSSKHAVRLGIIGLGHIGKYHIRAVESFRDFQLLAICDRHREYASLAGEGVAFYSDYHELLSIPEIETVIIATPNHTHYRIAMDVLGAGKELILEKPAAESLAELKNLMQTARSKNRAVYYAFHAASAFDVVWVANYIGNNEMKKELGPLTGFSCRFYDPYITREEVQHHAVGLQNCWLDSGINALSVLHHYLPLHTMDVANVSAAVNRNGLPSFNQCVAEFSFPVEESDQSGLGVIDTNWATGKNHKSTRLLFGRSGNVLEMDHSEQTVYRRYPDGSCHLLSDLSQGNERLYNHYIGVFQDYFALKNGKNRSGEMNSGLALHAHKLLFKAHELVNT